MAQESVAIFHSLERLLVPEDNQYNAVVRTAMRYAEQYFGPGMLNSIFWSLKIKITLLSARIFLFLRRSSYFVIKKL